MESNGGWWWHVAIVNAHIIMKINLLSINTQTISLCKTINKLEACAIIIQTGYYWQ